MPPRSPAPGTPEDWLIRARAKLALARVPLPGGGAWEDLCYMAHQTAELAVKSVYMRHGWPFPYVHDLGQLLLGLKSHGLTIGPEIQQADQLTDYAVATRYPGSGPAVGQAEYEDAVRIAAAVLAWAESFRPHP